ncbi:unnamed protein product, partial [Vitis vinifera]
MKLSYNFKLELNLNKDKKREKKVLKMFLLLKSWPSNSFVFNTAHTWYMALGCRRFSFLTFHIRSRRTLGSELLSLPKRSSRTFLRYSFLDAPWATILGFDTTNSIRYLSL